MVKGVSEAAVAKPLACGGAEGADLLLSRPPGDVILIDGAAPAAAAAETIGCLAAARGEKVVWSGPPALDLQALARRFAAAGAKTAAQSLAAPSDTPADPEAARRAGEARAGALAQEVAALKAAQHADRFILVLTPPDGARAPVGLSGHVWRPLGARLPAGETIALRAEASERPGMRVRLGSYSDVPKRGAAMRYDGVIEVGPALADTELRGRS